MFKMSKNNWDRTVFTTVQQTLSEQRFSCWTSGSSPLSRGRQRTRDVQNMLSWWKVWTAGSSVAHFSDWNRCSSKTCIHVETFADVEAAGSIVNNIPIWSEMQAFELRAEEMATWSIWILLWSDKTPVFLDHVHIRHLWWSFNLLCGWLNELCSQMWFLKVSWAHAVIKPVFKVTWSWR